MKDGTVRSHPCFCLQRRERGNVASPFTSRRQESGEAFLDVDIFIVTRRSSRENTDIVLPLSIHCFHFFLLTECKGSQFPSLRIGGDRGGNGRPGSIDVRQTCDCDDTSHITDRESPSRRRTKKKGNNRRGGISTDRCRQMRIRLCSRIHSKSTIIQYRLLSTHTHTHTHRYHSSTAS